MSFGDWLAQIFGTKVSKDGSVPNITDSSITFSSGHWFQPAYYLRDELYDTYARIDPFHVTPDYVKIINVLIREEPVLAACYQKHVTFADTEIEKFEIKGGSVDEIEGFLKTGIYYKTGIKSYLMFVVQQILLYGFCSAVIKVTDEGQVERLVIPQPWMISHRRVSDEWQAIYKNATQSEVDLDERIFVFEAPFLNQLNDGIFPVPVLKAAVMPSINYQLFQQSIKDICRRTGMQKIIGMQVGSAEKDLANLGMTQEQRASYRKQKALILEQTKLKMKETLPNGMIVHDGEINFKEISTVEPPGTLTTVADLLSNQVILGAKMFPAFVGASTRENQTTLTDNQKLSIRSLATTLQSSSHEWLKKLIIKYYFLQGKVLSYDDIEIVQKAPELHELLLLQGTGVDPAGGQQANSQTMRDAGQTGDQPGSSSERNS